MKKNFIVPALVVLIVIVFAAIRYSAFDSTADAGTGGEKWELEQAPDFELLDMDGTKVRLSDFKGKVIILDFWATWCPPCRMEIPHFIELYRDYKGQGLEVIGIALRQGIKDVRPFYEKNDINYTVLLDDGKVDGLYGGVRAIPTTFVIDRDGRITKKYIGYKDKGVFEKDIRELL